MSSSILLLTGILSGPVAAFLLDYPLVLAVIVFPLAGLVRLGWSWFLRLLLFGGAPGAFAVYGLASGNGEITERALRWCMALSAGMYFAGELDTSAMLSRILRRETGPFRGILRNLVLLLSLAGPVVQRARATFSESRREGMNLTSTVEKSIMSLRGALTETGSSMAPPSRLPLFLAGFSWILMLCSVAGVEIPA
jgi:hypothetical protein